jgi:hypothetical protein
MAKPQQTKVDIELLTSLAKGDKGWLTKIANVVNRIREPDARVRELSPEDITQEELLQIYENAIEFRGRGNRWSYYRQLGEKSIGVISQYLLAKEIIGLELKPEFFHLPRLDAEDLSVQLPLFERAELDLSRHRPSRMVYVAGIRSIGNDRKVLVYGGELAHKGKERVVLDLHSEPLSEIVKYTRKL